MRVLRALMRGLRSKGGTAREYVVSSSGSNLLLESGCVNAKFSVVICGAAKYFVSNFFARWLFLTQDRDVQILRLSAF